MDNEEEMSFTGDIQDDAVKMIADHTIQKTVIPGHLHGEDVFVLASIIGEDEEIILYPMAVILTEQMFDDLKLPEGLTEVPPPIPMNGDLNG